MIIAACFCLVLVFSLPVSVWRRHGSSVLGCQAEEIYWQLSGAFVVWMVVSASACVSVCA